MCQAVPHEDDREKQGILCQIAINVGILSAQAISMPFSTPGTEAWRKISFISILVAGMQVSTFSQSDPADGYSLRIANHLRSAYRS